MIRGVIVMNDQGKPRLIKFYEFQPPEKQQELVRSIYRILCSRAENVSNFVKADSLFGKDVRLVYKTFATLYFVFIFDHSENELAMIDLMQVFVETLNKCFKAVCELDIVFNFNKVHMILDEIILGGQVLETSIEEVHTLVVMLGACTDQRRLGAPSCAFVPVSEQPSWKAMPPVHLCHLFLVGREDSN
ncbi:Clathrin adaptor complex small chain family protein [Perilla frutescens var. hirtella]|nr:Clathrin adaptor complex small chain family protein [Perilla frutescens var. hirtella]KAH6811891.1 Clathrin adaptor complex small chain family protein [Perilla frutescens var. frutescens]